MIDAVPDCPAEGERPTVSVILIVKNGEPMIADALASVYQSMIKPSGIVVVGRRIHRPYRRHRPFLSACKRHPTNIPRDRRGVQ